MIPIRDTIRSRSFPFVNWVIIATNVLVFLWTNQMSQRGLNRLVETYSLIPARVVWLNPHTWYPFITSMFLHGGWFHLISNMWALFIFGDNVEDRLGSTRYLIFYLLGGVAAGAMQTVVMNGDTVPIIGASGAIAAVFGAYFLFYPRARVVTLLLIFILPWFVEIPAVVFLGFWFLSQLFSGLLSSAAASGLSGGIAWWAHIGGFLFGLALARPFSPRQRNSYGYPDETYPHPPF